MAHIGNAYLDVVPKFPGLESSVKKAMASIDTSSIGTQMGTSVGGGFKGGFVKAGAIAGIVSSMASQVTSQIGSHMASAVSRFDTLNNYPKVMEALGYTSQQATESIDLMSERLQVLPTRLDAMVSTVQGFTAITGDIDKSTKLGLALNDALLAGGQGAEVASAAAEQFRQILAKGKPEMQDWRSLTTAAPGQIDMLAKSLLGASAGANDLYLALGGGDQKKYDGPKIAMDEFIDKIIELDQVGADGLASFQQQAEEATGGLKTQLDNLSNAWTRGISDTFDVFGTDRVATIISDLKGGIKEGFSGFNDALFEELPTLDGLYATVKKTVGEITPLAGDLMESLAPIGSALVDSFAPAAEDVTDSIKTVVDVAKDAIDTVGPFATDVIGGLASHAGDIAVFAGSFSLLQAAGGKFKSFVGTVQKQSGVLKGAFDAFKQGYANGSSGGVLSQLVGDAGAAKSSFAPIPKLIEESAQSLGDLSGRVNEVENYAGGLRGAFLGANLEIRAQKTASDTAAQGYITLRDAIDASRGGMGDWKSTLEKFTPAADTAGEAVVGAKGKIKGFADSVKSNVKGLASGFSAFLGAGGLGIVLTGVSLIGSAVATAMLDAKEKSDNFKGATEGLAQAVANTTSLNTYKDAIGKIGESAELSVMSLDDLTEAGSDLTDKMNQRNKSAESQITQLERARQIIDNLAGRDSWTAEETGQAKWAVDKLNESLGMTLTLEDVKTDKWTNEQGEVQDLTDTIDDLIEKKKQAIKEDVILNNLNDAMVQRDEAAKTYGDLYSKATERSKQVVDQLMKGGLSEAEAWDKFYKSQDYETIWHDANQAKKEMDGYDQACKNLSNSMENVEKAADDGADAWTKFRSAMETDYVGATAALQNVTNALTGGKTSNEEFVTSLQEVGADVEKLSSLSQEDMIAIATSYDGTTQSLVDALAKYGVATDETMVKTAQVSDAIRGMGQDVISAVESGGGSLSDFAAKLQEAGVSTEQLNQIGSENMAALAQAFGGNLDQMVWAIQNYNNVPIINKDGSVTVNDSELIDAQGNVWTWNGTEFVDKDGNVAIEDQELIDAQGRVYVWNGSSLEPKSTTANAYGNIVDGTALSAVDRLKTALSGLHDKTINIRQYETIQKETRYITSTQNGGTTTGGARRDAAGGVMFHAEGYIANRAGTGVNIGTDRNGVTHYAGEAGAEAIVPLTNKRYATPFAGLIADLVAGRQDTGTHYNLYIDGASLTADKAASAAMEDLARVLMRRARTTRR